MGQPIQRSRAIQLSFQQAPVLGPAGFPSRLGSRLPEAEPRTLGLALSAAGTLNTVIIDNGEALIALIGVTGLPYGQTFTLICWTSSRILYFVPNIANPTGWNLHFERLPQYPCRQHRLWTDDSLDGIRQRRSSRLDDSYRQRVRGARPLHGTERQRCSNFSTLIYSAYLGVGGFGDNSWAQPDSLGGANNLYVENNNIYVTSNCCRLRDCPGWRRCRGLPVCGQVQPLHLIKRSSVSSDNHGLETDGRPQGGRQIEAYGNTVACDFEQLQYY